MLKDKKYLVFILSIFSPLLLKAEGQYLLEYFVRIMFCLALLAESYTITLVLIFTTPLLFDTKHRKRVRTTIWISSGVVTVVLLIIGLNSSNPTTLILYNCFF